MSWHNSAVDWAHADFRGGTRLSRRLRFDTHGPAPIVNLHFTNSFCANILLPKNYKAKLYLDKSCTTKLFCMKKSQVKC